jgi:hypothetical protein
MVCAAVTAAALLAVAAGEIAEVYPDRHPTSHAMSQHSDVYPNVVPQPLPLPGAEAAGPALRDAAEWIMTLNISSGALNNNTESFNHTYPGGAWAVVGGRHSIFQVSSAIHSVHCQWRV